MLYFPLTDFCATEAYAATATGAFPRSAQQTPKVRLNFYKVRQLFLVPFRTAEFPDPFITVMFVK